ncbi:hypothetical protein [Rickettsia endosymbiont of Gonocerus acuteangulatus]|uniref:hypothetical protein n=1 Tax=Rickettsia endosymbiont of Gonocerus acuteangulatus TaxID=3066266 RepID=UPI003132D198
MLIPPYYAASGGEYTQKRLNGSICNENVENSKCCHFSVPVNKDSNDPIIDLGEIVCE